MIFDGVRRARRLLNERATARFLRESLADIDAVLVSFPKSGRTWLRFALSCYFDRAASLGLNPDLTTTFRVLPNMDHDPVRGLPIFGYRGNPRIPLIAVTHRTYEPSFFRNAPVIFLVRDPRDVMVSAYFHATRHKHRFSGSLKAFLKDREQGLTALLHYLNGWALGLGAHPHLVVSYEAMSAAPADAIAGVLRFLAVPCDEIALAHAVEASSFEAMRRSEEQVGIPGHVYNRNDEQSRRMRKGKAGGYAEYLDDEDLAYVVAGCTNGLTSAAQALLAHTGFDVARPDCNADVLPDAEEAEAFPRPGRAHIS